MPKNCTTNVRQLHSFHKGLLSDIHSKIVVDHCSECPKCLALFVQVSEIMQGLKTPSQAEDLFVLRLSVNKIFDNVLDGVKEEIQEESTPIEEKPLKINVAQKTSRLTWNFNSTVKHYLPVVVAMLLALTLNSIYVYYYKRSLTEKDLPFKLSSTRTNRANNQNLYQQLNLAIDNYLASSNKSHLEEADILANQIQQQHQDNYGVDLVGYYKSVETKDFGKLQYLRQEVKELDKAPFSANETQNYLARAQKTQEDLLILGNILESYRAKYLLANRYLLINNTAYEPILDDGISYSESNAYVFLKVYFLVSKAKSEANDPDELRAKTRLEGIFALSKQLELNDITPSIAMSLAGVYQKHGENKKALEMSEDALKIPGTKHTTTISLMHVAGMASFALGDYDKSDKYFQDAVVLAQEHNNPFYLALSYSLAGSLANAKGNFIESQDLLEKAEKVSTAVTDEYSKARLMFNIKGHQAKLRLKEGKYLEASSLYKASLSNLEKIGIRSNLIQASELNEGLALALESTNRKDSRYYHTIADYLFRQGGRKKQINCLICFLPSQCN